MGNCPGASDPGGPQKPQVHCHLFLVLWFQTLLWNSYDGGSCIIIQWFDPSLRSSKKTLVKYSLRLLLFCFLYYKIKSCLIKLPQTCWHAENSGSCSNVEECWLVSACTWRWQSTYRVWGFWGGGDVGGQQGPNGYVAPRSPLSGNLATSLFYRPPVVFFTQACLSFVKSNPPVWAGKLS